MGLWDKLIKAERGLRARSARSFERATSVKPAEIRREILAQVESGILAGQGGETLPFGKIVVTLQPSTEEQRDAFMAAFLEGGSLEADVRRMIKGLRFQDMEEVQVIVRLSPGSASLEARPEPHPLFQLDFIRAAMPREREFPEIRVVVTKGAAEKGDCRFSKGHILIGRLSEVLDREGRLVRKNDLAFLDDGSDVNSSVSPIQARVWFDDQSRDYLIMDEVSRYGTRIVRGGGSIEVPPGDARGVRLQPGDEVYFGQACVRFELP
jgi:hypothetical protein